MLGNRRLDNRGHLVDVGIVADRKRRLEPVGGAGVGIVDDACCDKILIRDNDPSAIECLKECGARGHFYDRPRLTPVEFNVVADRRLPLDQQDHARDKV